MKDLKDLPSTQTNWVGERPDPDHSFGFIYKVTNLLTGKMYIGKKQYRRHLKVKVKGKKNRKSKTYQSDWKTYKTSSVNVQSDIIEFGEDNFEFEILFNVMTRAWLSYSESNIQHRLEVLVARNDNGERLYYNNQIPGVKFIPPTHHSKESRDKIAGAMIGKKHSDETKQKISKGNKGKVITQKQRNAISDLAKNRDNNSPTILEGRKKQADAMRGVRRLNRSKKVSTPNGVFPSVIEAAEAHSITVGAAYGRCNTGNKGWSYYNENKQRGTTND